MNIIKEYKRVCGIILCFMKRIFHYGRISFYSERRKKNITGIIRKIFCELQLMNLSDFMKGRLLLYFRFSVCSRYLRNDFFFSTDP